MRFKVLKSGMDGISGGESNYATIEEVLRVVSYYNGWSSQKELHKDIKKWSIKSKAGDVFQTQATAIVAVAVNGLDRVDGVCHNCDKEDLEYGEFEPVEGGEIEQVVECLNCGKRWKDIFTLTEQRELCNSD